MPGPQAQAGTARSAGAPLAAQCASFSLAASPNWCSAAVAATTLRGLFRACRVQSDCVLPAGNVTAREAQAACAADSCICVVPEGTALLLDSNLDVPALVVRGSLLWAAGGGTDVSAPRWLCAGYVVAEDNGRIHIYAAAGELPRSSAIVYIKDNGAQVIAARAPTRRYSV
eukprot:SAG22_NODE_389_length_11276_cov_12.397244_7_plen_171_part_00